MIGNALSSMGRLVAQNTTKAAGKGALDKVLDIVGSKGGQTLIGAAGAGLEAYGANKRAEADRAQNAAQFRANLGQRQAEFDREDQFSRAKTAADMNPLGANQGFAQKNALLAAILPGLRNFSATPGDPRVASAMGKTSGGFQLPEGGLDPAMIQRLFGDAATQASIAERAKSIGQVNPNAPAPPIHDLYGRADEATGAENPFMTDIRTANELEARKQEEEREKQRELIRRALEEDIAGTKAPGRGVKGRLAGAGMGAATGFATGGPVGALIGGLAGLF
jgi:hypothetical protein